MLDEDKQAIVLCNEGDIVTALAVDSKSKGCISSTVRCAASLLQNFSRCRKRVGSLKLSLNMVSRWVLFICSFSKDTAPVDGVLAKL